MSTQTKTNTQQAPQEKPVEELSKPVDVKPKEKPVEPTKELKVAKPMELKDGAITPLTIGELKSVLEKVASGGGFPARFDNEAKRIAAYNLAHSLMGDKWQLCLNNIAIIQGQMTIYGELPGTLAQNTGELTDKKVFLINSKYEKICTENKNLADEPWAGICKITRKNREESEFFYTIEQAKQAGQYPSVKAEWKDNKKTGKQILNTDSPWNKHLGIMLMRKAMALSIKIVFPDAMIGVQVSEYDLDDSAPDLVPEREVGPSPAETIRGSFKEEQEKKSS